MTFPAGKFKGLDALLLADRRDLQVAIAGRNGYGSHRSGGTRVRAIAIRMEGDWAGGIDLDQPNGAPSITRR